MTEENFRQGALALINPDLCKVWLAQIRGPRLDFLLSAGSEQLAPVEKVARANTWIVVGQRVPESLRPQFKQLVAEFAAARGEPSEVSA